MPTDIAVHNTVRKEKNVMNNNPNRCNSRKEKKMIAITKTTPLAMLVALGLTLTAWAAEPLPYGHKDFVPTPEQPVYFRQTSGNYPGATPPLEWWEGTPTTKKVKVKECTHATGSEGWRSGEGERGDFADQKSKNILWKVPVPGWSMSHPIVVGKKVFAVGEPDFVTCWDLDTGKQLWQRRTQGLFRQRAGSESDRFLVGRRLPADHTALVPGQGADKAVAVGEDQRVGACRGNLDPLERLPSVGRSTGNSARAAVSIAPRLRRNSQRFMVSASIPVSPAKVNAGDQAPDWSARRVARSWPAWRSQDRCRLGGAGRRQPAVRYR